jgi:hypothetical protein
MADRARGHHLARAGAAGAAEQAFERAAALFEELGNPSSAGLDRLWRAEQLFALGQPADAEAEVTRADALLAGSDIPVADLVRARLPTARRPATADDPAPVAAPTPTPVPGPAPASGTGPVPVRESAADRPAPTPGERDGQAPPRT